MCLCKRKRQVYFKGLAHAIMGVVAPKIYRAGWQTEVSGRSRCCNLPFKNSLEAEFLFLRETVFSLKACRPTNIMKSNLLYSRLLIWKIPLQQLNSYCSKARYHDLAKSAHKIDRHTENSITLYILTSQGKLRQTKSIKTRTLTYT